MPAEDVLALLGDLMAGPLPQAVVAAVNWSALKPAYEARRQRPLLALLGGAAAQPERNEATKVDASGVGGQPQRVTEMQAPPLLAAYRAARPEDRPDLLIAALRGSVAKIVGMADPEAIDLHQGLFEMGMDSLMSVELKTQLERQVGCALPSTLTFNYPTIHDLAGYLVQNALADVAPPSPPMPAVESAPGSGGRNAAEPAAAAAAEIDDLSEDELAQRLMQRLRQLR
jgi:acyl carrier protein